jgi:serine/threonine protein kinase
MPSSLVSPCRSTDALGDAFRALGIVKDCEKPLANGVEMELLRQRVIVVLMEQLSNSLGPLAPVATHLQKLAQCGIVTRDALPLLVNSEEDTGTGITIPSDVSDVPGVYSRFEQDFDKLELMGRGAFGEVWRCRHRLDGCEYAVKAVHFQINSGDKNYMKLAAREARTMAGLAPHQSILRYYGSWLEVNEVSKANSLMGLPRAAGTELPSQRSTQYTIPVSDYGSDGEVTFERDDNDPCYQGALVVPNVLVSPRAHGAVKNEPKAWGTLYIQTELCEKDTLAKWIAERNEAITSTGITAEERELWAKRSYEIFNDCVHGIRHLHGFGCVHRDIKPLNILFKADGRVQLADFGLAKMLDNPAAEPTGMLPLAASTAASNALMLHTRGMGTPSYASPEQLLGGAYGVEADVFSLGVVLAELLNPLRTQMERAVMFEQLHHRRRLPNWVENTFPATARLALAMTEPEAKKRPTMDQIAKILPIVMSEMQQHFRSDSTAVETLQKQLPAATIGQSIYCLPESSAKTVDDTHTDNSVELPPTAPDVQAAEEETAVKPSQALPKQTSGDVAAYEQPKEIEISASRGSNTRIHQILKLQVIFTLICRSVLLSGLLGGTPESLPLTQQSMVMAFGQSQVDSVDGNLLFDVLPDLRGRGNTFDLEDVQDFEAHDLFTLDLSIGISAAEAPPERGQTVLKPPPRWWNAREDTGQNDGGGTLCFFSRLRTTTLSTSSRTPLGFAGGCDLLNLQHSSFE